MITQSVVGREKYVAVLLKKYFARTSNSSIAANTEEVVFQTAITGFWRSLTFRINHAATGSSSSYVSISIGSVTVLVNTTFADLFQNYCGGVVGDWGGDVSCILYDDTNKHYAFCFRLNSWHNNDNIYVRIKNADAAATANCYASVTYQM